MRVESPPRVDAWPAFHHNDVESLASQAGRQGAARGTRTDDTDVENGCVYIHGLKELERQTATEKVRSE